MGCGRGGRVVMLGLDGWCGRVRRCAARRLACVRSATPTRRPVSRGCWARCRWWPSSAGGWACPMRAEVARVTHGQVVEALVANRLSSPRPLLRVQDWAHEWAVEEVFGIEAAALNDDRIGRALDAIAPELERIVGSVGARAVATFGLDVARLHWDMT